MNKRKILALAMALSMVAILAVGATLAYFTDTGSATNVLTVGNVNIEVYEQQYKGGKWEDFNENDIVMLPTSNETGVTLYNKAVNTKNVSSYEQPVYIRTIVAFEDYEAGEGDPETGIHYSFNTANHTYDDGTIRYAVNDPEVYDDMKIDDVTWDVVVFTTLGNAAVDVNDYVQSMNGVWLDENLTQEKIKSTWGEKVTIEVLSQAIQAYDLDHDEAMAQLGEITNENLSKWFDIEVK